MGLFNPLFTKDNEERMESFKEIVMDSISTDSVKNIETVFSSNIDNEKSKKKSNKKVTINTKSKWLLLLLGKNILFINFYLKNRWWNIYCESIWSD